MTNSLTSSLQTLPVEILHYILDNLDAQTILFSFRNTCQRFKTILNNYDRYVLNFESISKPDFERLCRLVKPYHVTSLTLSDNDETLDQIKLFISHFNLRQFSRLRILSIFIAEEEQLKTIVERFNICSLKSFSLKIKKFDDRRKTTTAKLLSSIIAKSNLLKLDLNIQEGRLEKVIWPSQYSIQYLRIDNVIYFDQICTILRCLPQLRTLIISSVSILLPNKVVLTPFQHLTSLTLSKLSTEIDNLELFLSLVPSLIYLKLIGYGNYCDGNRWEHFIKSHLPLLNKFEFFFSKRQNPQENPPDINQIIESFQTPFWLDCKKWFVICEADLDPSRYVRLYSIPICVSFLAYETKQISISNYPVINDKKILIMDNVDTISLDFRRLMSESTKNKVYINYSQLFVA